MPVLDLSNDIMVKKYENYVKESPYGHMLQSMGWKEVKNNWDADYVYLEDENGDIRAALSILSVKNDGENAFMYAPRGPVCDFYDIETVQELIKEAMPAVKKRNGFFLRMDPEVMQDHELVEKYRSLGYAFRSNEQENIKVFTNPKHNMILDLEDISEEEVMKVFSSNQRTKIRKTYKNGLNTRIIRVSDLMFEEALDRFYSLTVDMSKRQGILYRPKEYFVRLMNAYSDACIFETFDDENEVLSTCIVVSYNKKSFYIYAASSNNKRNLNASIQMNYEAILYAIRNGYKQYDMGGIFDFEPSNGLYMFKYNFCGGDGHKEFIGELDVVFNEDLYSAFNSK
ncbi:MAG TPA: methicillin resistance protein [Proteiniclasticum sp.]|uniref:lipid II:glycine glycyltransferase FemX n=1 Tax=Proteiniclasticum sp. TaxID=2053595 RepID=UPI000E8D43FF|nr:peptidoglycan bridge formation glycyltransferase FemA/FemB family protein [Proteiniclasticum sp.]HBW12896.1 methicillin resistance protein [Proteiniclasticum sp.]